MTASQGAAESSRAVPLRGLQESTAPGQGARLRSRCSCPLKSASPATTAAIPGAHGFGPFRFADREQDTLTGSVIAGYHHIDLVGCLAPGVVDYPLADLRHSAGLSPAASFSSSAAISRSARS